jgi:hypothetical protein
VLLQIENALEEHAKDKPPLSCELYQMVKGASRGRSLDAEGAIKNLMQGSNANTGYPGDRAICDPQRVTIQIHTLTLREDTEEGRGSGPTVAEHVPALAVAIPKRMRADSLIEDDDE